MGTENAPEMQPDPFSRCATSCLAEHTRGDKNPQWISWGPSEMNPFPNLSLFMENKDGDISFVP